MEEKSGEKWSCKEFLRLCFTWIPPAGYYKDLGLEGWSKAKQEQARIKPTAIKANKSLVKIPNRGGAVEPTAKKPKTGLYLLYMHRRTSRDSMSRFSIFICATIGPHHACSLDLPVLSPLISRACRQQFQRFQA